MALPTTTINWDNVNALTTMRWLPKVVDNIFRSNPVIMTLKSQGTMLDGGERIVQPLIYGEGPGGAYSGAEPLDTSIAEQITAATFNWKYYYASTSILRQDELKNSGKAAFTKLLRIKMQVMEETMQNLLGQGLYSDGSTNPKLITGLRAMVTGTGTTYGNISKTTESWWRSKIDSTTVNITIPTLRTLMGQCTEGRRSPNLAVTTQIQYNKVYELLQPQQRFANVDMANAGFVSLQLEGRPLAVDSHCPAGYFYLLNTNFIDFVTHQDENMRMEPFVKPYNQPQVRTAFLFWAGNLTGSNCRFQGAFTALSES